MKLIIKILGIIALVMVLLIALLASYIEWFDSPSFEQKSPTLSVDSTSQRLIIGKKIVTNFCVSCHLSDQGTLSGKVMIRQKQWGLIAAANLSQHSESVISSYSDGELFYFLRTGIKKNGKLALPMMPRLGTMSDEDIYSLIAFLRSDDELLKDTETHTPVSEPSFFLKALMKFEIRPVPYNEEPISTPSPADEMTYGSYLVNGRYSCFECHSRSTANINYLNPSQSEGYLGGGSNLMVFGSDVGIRSANITPHPDAGIGAWTYFDFEKAVTEGIRPDGKFLRPPMNRLTLDSTEIHAIWKYLRSVPPISNQWDYDHRMEIPEG